MDKNHDGNVTLDEFIKVFIEAEDILRTKVENCSKFIKDYQKQRTEAANKLNEVKRTEVLNENGIMQGSTASATVIEAQILNKQVIDCYVEILCDQQRVQTNVSKIPGTPNWNETFAL